MPALWGGGVLQAWDPEGDTAQCLGCSVGSARKEACVLSSCAEYGASGAGALGACQSVSESVVSEWPFVPSTGSGLRANGRGTWAMRKESGSPAHAFARWSALGGGPPAFDGSQGPQEMIFFMISEVPRRRCVARGCRQRPGQSGMRARRRRGRATAAIRPRLGHGGHIGVELLLAVQGNAMVHEDAAGHGLGLDFGELEACGLEGEDGLAEGLAILAVLGRLFLWLSRTWAVPAPSRR